MTIQIKITNEDTRENAIIAVTTHETYSNCSGASTTQELKGGQSCEIYLHNEKTVAIKEVQTA